MDRKKVLIVDDDNQIWWDVLSELTAEFGDGIEIYPQWLSKPNDETADLFRFQNQIIDSLRDENLNLNILNGSPDFIPDLLIVDKSIFGSSDSKGYDFADIIEVKNRSLKQIRISSTRAENSENSSIKYLDKRSEGDALPASVVEQTYNFFPYLNRRTEELKEFDAKRSAKPPRSRGIIEWIRTQPFVSFIDPFFHLVFYLLVVGAIGVAASALTFSVWNVVSEIRHEASNSDGSEKKPTVDSSTGNTKISNNLDENVSSASKDTTEPKKKNEITRQLLILAETIFLCFLPVLILLGLFNYYRKSISLSLRGNETAGIDEEATAKTMNLSKTLFITSLISYVFIKAIEELFNRTARTPEYEVWIAYGVLILLLMTYLMVINLSGHRKS